MKPATLAFPALLCSACLHVTVSSTDPPRAGAGLAPGDRVVGRWMDDFWEATVITVHGNLVTVAWDQPPPETSRLPRGFVERLDARGGAVQAGDWRLCGREGRWSPCRVEARQQDHLRVTLLDGAARVVAAADTLPVPADLLEWVRARGDERIAAGRLRDLGLVPVTVGQPAERGRTVLARWEDGSWWEALVKEVGDGQVVAAWMDGSPPSTLPAAAVAPLRQGGLRPGDLALCKRDASTRWVAARVDQVNGLRLVAAFDDGVTTDASQDECVAAVASQPPGR